jgi:chromosomal replication initiation ATPase DnaA
MKRQQDFENFYVYEGNKVAYLAAQKIIEFPGELFNPLYVYAGTGLGKTHFLMALQTELNKKNTTKFFAAKEFEEALDKIKVFDSAIVVDDLHMITSSYHDALLGVIDTALASNRQVCFSGNAPPRDIKSFDARLISRIEGGLVCDILPPKEMALVDLIKQKSSEAGVLLPDAVALELAQISTGSIRKIEGMINRIVAYSSLGSLSLDTDSIRMILKEFYPKGIYSPVSSLIEELKKNASEVLANVSEKLDEREEYKEKIYIWEMKGFDTSALKPLLEGDLGKFKTAYDEFIVKVERLIELQKEFGSLDTHDFPDEAMKIESMLFSPAHVDEIEELIAKIKKKIKIPETKKAFDDYFVGSCNSDAYSLYKEQVAKSLGEKFNPFVIYGKDGTGRTRFLSEIKTDLESTDEKVLYADLGDDDTIKRFDKSGEFDVLIIDNFHRVFSFGDEIRQKVFHTIRDYIDNKKAVIFSSATFPSGDVLSEDEKSIFDFGIETGLKEPCSEVAEAYIKARVDKGIAEKMINAGLPEFVSYSAIDEFIESFDKAIAVKEPVGVSKETTIEEKAESVEEEEGAAEEEMVPLALAGETAEPEKTTDEESESVIEVASDEVPEQVVALGLPGEETAKPDEIIPGEQDTEPPSETAEQADTRTEPLEEPTVVSLGLPGEEEAKVAEHEAEAPVVAEAEKIEPVPVKGEPLKEVREEKFIINEIPGELIEDNF